MSLHADVLRRVAVWKSLRARIDDICAGWEPDDKARYVRDLNAKILTGEAFAIMLKKECDD